MYVSWENVLGLYFINIPLVCATWKAWETLSVTGSIVGPQQMLLAEYLIQCVYKQTHWVSD